MVNNLNIETIREQLSNLVGKNVLVVVDIGRNRKEKLCGVVKHIYSYVFIIDINGEKRSFSYVDVLIKNVIVSVI